MEAQQVARLHVHQVVDMLQRIKHRLALRALVLRNIRPLCCRCPCVTQPASTITWPNILTHLLGELLQALWDLQQAVSDAVDQSQVVNVVVCRQLPCPPLVLRQDDAVSQRLVIPCISGNGMSWQ